MRTKPDATPASPVWEAARALRSGGIVVYPTDTLYGLGAPVRDPAAVRRVFLAKHRPPDQPLSIAVAEPAAVAQVAQVTPLARRLLRLLPGPLTLLLEKTPAVPDVVTGGQPTVGVRVPDHPVCLDLLRRAGPLTATSANLHGRPDPTTIEEARTALGDRVDYYLASPSPLLGAPSTLVDCRGAEPRVLREGILSEARLRELLAD